MGSPESMHLQANVETGESSYQDNTVREKKSRSAEPTARRVTFQRTARVRKFHASKKRDTWYNSEDYQGFRQSCRSTVDGERDMPEDPTQKVCNWGLEHLSCPARCQLRRDRRSQAFDAVWEEQLLQEQEDVFCEEELAKVYRQFSLSGQREAHIRALTYWEELRRQESSDQQLLHTGKTTMAELWSGVGKEILSQRNLSQGKYQVTAHSA